MPTRSSRSLASDALGRAVRAVGLGLAAAFLFAACSGAAATPSAAAGATTTPATPAASPAGTADAGATEWTSGSATKVSANTASQSELLAALTAAGVPNASQWVREVMEYRPYASDDATLQRLQDNLAKYNPDPATLAAILAALKP